LASECEGAKKKRWLRALQLAKILFEDEGYFIDYLVEIEEWIKNNGKVTGMEDKMEKDIQLLVVDDHQVVREGLRHLLGQEEDIELIGQAANSEETLLQLEMFSPNIVLMDIKMPGVDGIELTRQIMEKQPACSVIMLTLYDEYLAEAMEAGAKGYLLKDIKRKELVQAIRQVHRGEIVISDSITAKPRIEYEERAGEKAEGDLLQEVQMVIPPPVDAAQLIRFVSRVEEMLHSRVAQMIGSWREGTAVTIPLLRPTPLANILNKLEEMSEVEATGEKPLTGEGNPSLLKKTATTSRPKTRPSKIIFVTLKNG